MIRTDETIQIESGITGGLLRGRVLSTTRVGETHAVNTEVAGSAHITGFHQFVIDPDDPLRNGFLIEEV